MGRNPRQPLERSSINESIKTRIDISIDEIISIAESKFRSLNSGELKLKNKFKSAQHLAEWWADKFIEQDGKCCYCKTSIKLMQDLINKKLLKTRSVGRDGSGRRGYQFELERCDSDTNYYSPENCKLACYYCNNDKSYIFPANDFEEFMGKAKGEYFLFLSKKMNE